MMLKNRLKNKYQGIINEINLLENDLKALSDSQLRTQNFKLQKQYQETENLDSLIAESFALTREASRRTLGLRHFDVQLIGGIVLNSNKIAEMKTGEGKTLVATLPATLNALTKKGVHIVTVNDYLANRDQISMGQIYRFIGFDTGLIQSKMSLKNRQENYKSDITYVTNYELTFDYLRDNLATSSAEVVLRPFNYCIIDEVDSILIDEANTPLIISNSINLTKKERDKYIITSEVVKYLDINIDYRVDEKNKNVVLTEAGSRKAEQLIQVPDLYDVQDPWIPYLLNALRALTLFFKNVHYIIQKNRIVIVDEFTGRIMPDRRWGDGLHQAIEAKEEVGILPRTETQAAITYQNFFLLYPKLSGMTGTGKTAEIEFEKIYKLLVDRIPTAQPPKRMDLPDLLYKDQFSKWDAITRFCKKISLTGQPILIGTTTVEKSEMLAQLLNEYKLSYQILNAKPENVRRESQIVAEAGNRKTITIATNMAGRGTDIILGGNIDFQTQKGVYELLVRAKLAINKVKKFHKVSERDIRYEVMKKLITFNKFRTITGCSHKFYSVLLNLANDSTFLKFSDIDVLKVLQQNDRISIPKIPYQCTVRFLLNEVKNTNKKYQTQENQIVKNLGGLCVIGTERNNSRRVDNQLRGRCGRQGDPGTSHFFLSLDDNLIRLFGGAEIQNLAQNQLLDGSPLESEYLTQALDSAQQQVEERAFDQRKNLFDYDQIVDQQRNLTYFQRQKILESKQIYTNSLALLEQVFCNSFVTSTRLFNRLNVMGCIRTYESFLGTPYDIPVNLKRFIINIYKYTPTEWKVYFYQEAWVDFQLKKQCIDLYDSNIFATYERLLYLKNIDRTWKDHLETTALLREAVGWRAYAQANPLTEYKRDACIMFTEREQELAITTIYEILRLFIV